jgi:arsenite oxidase small subunit
MLVDESRRRSFKLMALVSLGLGFAGILPLLKSATPSSAPVPKWPNVRIANIKDLVVDTPKIFMYPLEDTPNILVKLGKRVGGGVGPEGDIVAYSQVCQHLGCFVRFQQASQQSQGKDTFYCPCHAGIYDADQSAQVIGGPPLYQLPPVLLRFDDANGDIFAYGMGPPVIFGKGPPGSTEVSQDLLGGTLVAGTGA